MYTRTITRRLAAVLLVTVTSLALQPLQATAQNKLAQDKAAQAPGAPGTDEQYARLLDDLKETAQRGADKARKGQATRDDARALRRHKKQLQALEAQVDDAFAATEAELVSKRLPPEILARHRAAVADYQAKQTEFKRQIKTLEDADDQDNEPGRANGMTTLSTWMEQNHKGKAHTKTDPNKLPFRTPDSKVRPPIESETGYKTRQALFGIKPVHLAGAIPSGGIAIPLATDPKAPPSAADLGETEDIQLTPAIRAQAQALGNNPVHIHNWVRNTIEFIPTYGSIQGADMTLQTKRGNAFDTASLEIALLRAAGIPARYIYGTIQLPIDQAMNWIGGVSKPETALNLMGQGGIPSIGLVTGGQISHIKMEHVWIEAWIDYVPSRGAINREGDSWISLDGSYKQYQYTQGMDIKNAVPLDAQNLLTQAQQGATVNQAEGWVQNLNQTNIQTVLTNYQTQVKNHIASQKPDATVGDVLGAKTILQKNPATLLGTLPYQTLAVGNRMSGLPDGLRHSITLNLYSSDVDRSLGSPALTYKISLASLNTKRLGVTYAPASEADAQVIQSYRDQGALSLPLYLIQVRPLIQLDGVTVGSGQSVGMGQSQYWDVTLTDPQAMTTGTESFKAVAGSEIVFGVNGNGITPSAVQERLAAMPSHTAAENLQQVALHYWMEHDLFDELAASANGVHKQRLPSVGLFASALSVSYFFGIPRSGNYKGRQMDVKRILLAIDGGTERSRFTFASQSGIQGSYLEGVVFDQLFQRMQGKSVSAAQLLGEANRQGIPIYSITRENLTTALSALTVSSDVKNDIANAVNAGKVAVVPQSELAHGNYTGVGYILQDPQTGAAAYLINGGLNGAEAPACQSSLAPLAAAVSAGVAAIMAAALATSAASALTITVGSMTTAGGALLLFPSIVISGPIIAIVAFTLMFVAAVYLFMMEMQILMATGGIYATTDECSCLEQYKQCLMTGLADLPGGINQSRCEACLDRCDKVTNQWPTTIEIGTCAYWRY